MRIGVRSKREWHWAFPFFPVRIGDQLIFWEWIEARYVDDISANPHWEYKLIERTTGFWDD